VFTPQTIIKEWFLGSGAPSPSPHTHIQQGRIELCGKRIEKKIF